MADKESLLTQEGLDQHKEEFEFLKITRRTKIAEKVRVARGLGDLSESAEYDEAENEQAQVKERINYLESLLSHAKVVQDDKSQKDVITVGPTVTCKSLNLNKETTCQIVGAAESDPFVGRISNESPTGKALLDLRVDDTTEIKTPDGAIELRALTVKKG